MMFMRREASIILTGSSAMMISGWGMRARAMEMTRSGLGLPASATPHAMRHSFATHLIHKGVSLRHIQELLGHESSKTTEVYTHLTGDQLREVKSPLEGLDI